MKGLNIIQRSMAAMQLQNSTLFCMHESNKMDKMKKKTEYIAFTIKIGPET